MLVVPDPSDRWTTLMAVLGRLAPGLAAARAGSFQVAILPRKMPAMISGVILIGAESPVRLYATTTAPKVVGTSIGAPFVAATAMSESERKASEPPKSTVFCCQSLTPAPEPTDW